MFGRARTGSLFILPVFHSTPRHTMAVGTHPHAHHSVTTHSTLRNAMFASLRSESRPSLRRQFEGSPRGVAH
eukprot:1198503-Rhodomonas_salina.1